MILVFLLVEEEIVLGRVVRPDVFDGFVDFAVIFQLGQVLDHFLGNSGAVGIVDEFFFGSWSWSIVQAAGKFKCPIHIKSVIIFTFRMRIRPFCRKDMQNSLYPLLFYYFCIRQISRNYHTTAGASPWPLWETAESAPREGSQKRPCGRQREVALGNLAEASLWGERSEAPLGRTVRGTLGEPARERDK